MQTQIDALDSRIRKDETATFAIPDEQRSSETEMADITAASASPVPPNCGDFVSIPEGQIHKVIGKLQYDINTERLKREDLEINVKTLRRNVEAMRNSPSKPRVEGRRTYLLSCTKRPLASKP